MYGLHDYEAMLADSARTVPYLEALRRAVRPGDVVVEIGTGVGYFAVAAARCGARHVYAIETNPLVVLGPEIAAASGCGDRVTFIRKHSTRVTLPERADVLLEDMRGLLPLVSDHIASVRDARDRLLRPGATIIPVQDTLWMAPAEADDAFRKRHLELGDTPYGIDRRAVHRHVRNTWCRARLREEQVLAPPVAWGVVDFATITSPDVSGHGDFVFDRPGRVEGLCLWFDTDLGFGCGFSNAPDKPQTIYAQAFFPLERGVDVERGDRLAVDVRAACLNGQYVWSWNSRFEPAAGATRERVHFRQSTLGAEPNLLERLHRHREEHAPRLGASGALLRDLLVQADGVRTLREIAEALYAANRAAFANADDAVAYTRSRLGALEDDGEAEFPS